MVWTPMIPQYFTSVVSVLTEQSIFNQDKQKTWIHLLTVLQWNSFGSENLYNSVKKIRLFDIIYHTRFVKADKSTLCFVACGEVSLYVRMFGTKESYCHQAEQTHCNMLGEYLESMDRQQFIIVWLPYAYETVGSDLVHIQLVSRITFYSIASPSTMSWITHNNHVFNFLILFS